MEGVLKSWYQLHRVRVKAGVSAAAMGLQSVLDDYLSGKIIEDDLTEKVALGSTNKAALEISSIGFVCCKCTKEKCSMHSCACVWVKQKFGSSCHGKKATHQDVVTMTSCFVLFVKLRIFINSCF